MAREEGEYELYMLTRGGGEEGGLQICQNKCIKRILAKTHNIICHNSRLPNMQGANYSFLYKA